MDICTEHMQSVLAVCLNPTFEKTMVFDSFYENEVNRTAEYFLLPAGKGLNVTRVITRLGAQGAVLSHLGGAQRAEFLDLCKEEKITLEHFLVNSPVRFCINIIDMQKKTSTKLVEEPLPVEAQASKKAFDLYLSLFGKFDAVVITGTKAAGYEADLYPRMTEVAKKAGKLVVLDVKGEDLRASVPFKPDIIKPNLSEFISTFAKGLHVLENDDSESLRETVRFLTEKLYARYGTKSVISRGKYPAWVYDGKVFYEIPNVDVPVINTIGCGDALTAGLTLSLLEGKNFDSSVRFGMNCAAENAQSLYHGLKKNAS